MRDIGKNIRELRQMRNMTQDELAEKLFVTRQTVSNYETGKSRPDIDMLARIAETLETDPNTVLYGVPVKPERRRARIRLCISAAVLAVAWIGYLVAADLGTELADHKWDHRLELACTFFGAPLLAFLFGWTAMEALGVFARLAPFQEPWAKRMKWIVAGTAAGYLLIILPTALTYIVFHNMETPAILIGSLFDALYWATAWLTGRIHGMHWSPNILLFGILGCALWLGFLPKARK